MLKLNQQTVRNWIDQGSLPAVRVAGGCGSSARTSSACSEECYSGRPAPGADRARAPSPGSDCRAERGVRSRRRARRTSGAASRSRIAEPAERNGSAPRELSQRRLDRQRAQVMRAVRQASNELGGGDAAHKLAPPDLASPPGCGAGGRRRERAGRVGARARRGSAVAARPGRRAAEPPYELRPGTGRRGPARAVGPVRPCGADAQPGDHRLRCGRRRGRVRRDRPTRRRRLRRRWHEKTPSPARPAAPRSAPARPDRPDATA